MPRYSHRPAFPDDPKRRETDRTALCDGERIGRTYLIEGGPRNRMWYWTAYGPGLPSLGTGAEPTREEALAAIKAAHSRAVRDTNRRRDSV